VGFAVRRRPYFEVMFRPDLYHPDQIARSVAAHLF
jgi:hypothetical protein